MTKGKELGADSIQHILIGVPFASVFFAAFLPQKYVLSVKPC